MNISTLKMFQMVSDEKGFSAAGRRLFITASAVIQKMQQLEDELGFPLFIRKYNGVSLTEEGEAFYQGVSFMLKTLDSTLDTCAQIRKRTQNVINIGMHTPSLMSAYQMFEQLHPDCICNYIIFQESDVDKIFSQFMDNSLQIIEWPALSRLGDHGIEFLTRYPAEVCCIMARNHPFASRFKLTLEDLVGQSLRIYSHKNQEVIEEALEEALRNESIQALRYESIKGESNAVIEACKKGALILVSKAYAKTLPLIALPLEPPLCVHFGLAYKRQSTENVQRLIRFVKEYDEKNCVFY